MALAMAFLVKNLSSLFSLRFAFKKFAITGTSMELVTLAQRQLGQYAGAHDDSIISLGIDFALGKSKSCNKSKAKRKER